MSICTSRTAWQCTQILSIGYRVQRNLPGITDPAFASVIRNVFCRVNIVCRVNIDLF